MSDESALERQMGNPAPARQNRVPQLPRDPVWENYLAEYWRMRTKGLTREEASEVFRPLLSDPARKDAADLMISSAHYHGERRLAVGKPLPTVGNVNEPQEEVR